MLVTFLPLCFHLLARNRSKNIMIRREGFSSAKAANFRVQLDTLGIKPRTTMEKVGRRFSLPTASTDWTRSINKAMSKAMFPKIIQVDTQLSEKLKDDRIKNSKIRLFLGAHSFFKSRLKFAISINRSSVSREFIPMILTVREKIIFETGGGCRGAIVNVILKIGWSGVSINFIVQRKATDMTAIRKALPAKLFIEFDSVCTPPAP